MDEEQREGLEIAIRSWIGMYEVNVHDCHWDADHERKDTINNLIGEMDTEIGLIQWPDNLAFLHEGHDCKALIRELRQKREEIEYLERKIGTIQGAHI